MLCSDLSIRSGTAVRLRPEHYDNTHAMLRFTTKLGECLTLPVTNEIRIYQETGDAHDPDAIVEHVEAMEAKAVIPPKRNRKVQREYDKDLYKQRNRIERCFNKLGSFRRFATRYEKSKACFHALVALACAWLHLRYRSIRPKALPACADQ